MFGINLSSISMLSTVALGPVGGLAAQLGTQIFAGMGQQLLQGMGERLNLPQSVIDIETAGFSAQTGDIAGGLSGMRDSISSLGQETRAGLADIQTQQQDTEDALHQILDNLAQSPEVKEIRENGGRGGGSWLRAMADALGKKLDALADEMNDLANKITKSDPSTTTDFTVASQEFNMLMSATTNAIKTVGEAMGKSASRQ